MSDDELDQGESTIEGRTTTFSAAELSFDVENAAKKKFVTTGKVKDYIVQAMDTASRVNNIVKRLHEFNGPLDEKLRNIGIDPSIYGMSVAGRKCIESPFFCLL